MTGLSRGVIDSICRDIAFNISMYGQVLISVHGSADATEVANALKAYLESVEDGSAVKSTCKYVPGSAIYRKPVVEIIESSPDRGIEFLLDDVVFKRRNGQPDLLYILCDPDERFDYQHCGRLPERMGVVDLGAFYRWGLTSRRP